MDKLFALVKELASQNVWSAAVELSRNAEIAEWRQSQDGDRFFRLSAGPKDAVRAITLSEESEVWQCDCALDEDPCRHVIAAVLCAKQGRLSSALAKRAFGAASIIHEFRRERGCLSFSRALLIGDVREPILGTLAEAIRRSGRSLALSESDERIEYVLVGRKSGVIEPQTVVLLVQALSRVSLVELDGAPVSADAKPLGAKIVVSDDALGWRVNLALPMEVDEVFENGAALKDGVLYGVTDSGLKAEELRAFRGAGRLYPRSEAAQLASVIIPSLQDRIEVEIQSNTLPRARLVAPRIVIETVSSQDGSSLTLLPRLVYGKPAFAEVRQGRLELQSLRELPIRDPVGEGRLSRDLEARLGLRLDEAKGLRGLEAAAFAARLRGWDITGDGTAVFQASGELSVAIEAGQDGVALRLTSPHGSAVSVEDALRGASAGRALWHVPGEGWFTLPKVFMGEHREIFARLLASRGGAEKRAAATLLPDIDEACALLGMEAPPYFERLRTGLRERGEIAGADLPADLSAQLRPYQERGVAWLAFLREYGLCGLLADDMGLGKTVQALAIVRGRTLVVAPTSVLRSWEQQARKFRPGVSCSVYHGGSRSLEALPDLLITSYGLLRQDIEALSGIEWDAVVLDESQLIRNPDSITARAAFSLRAKWRLSLSGTPVENSLLDLWSQMRFLQPELLGTRSDFERRFIAPISRGDSARTAELRRRVAPFILRRLKRDVATELPPKTEVVLECQLWPEERQRYDALMLGVRSEADALLADGASALTVLELLLRLRQACCHGALLPGISCDTSSKVELLMESLLNSTEQGHRALVFSQWTALLDLVEQRLLERGISFSRIDGSTLNRQEIVDQFQRDDGPLVMLLSLKAGGLGLTLTAADHVYILDPWWNPAAEDQAGDRAHRIGQESPVVVHRLVAQGTVEEKILALQERKRGLSREIVGERSEVALNREELLSLLQ